MKLLSDWGITSDWWRGLRGEYWVIAQGVLLFCFAILPNEQPSFINIDSPVWNYSSLGLIPNHLDRATDGIFTL
jgi:hypothetical protein